jgi:hypothetical protein
MTLPTPLSRACMFALLLSAMVLSLEGKTSPASAQGVEEWNKGCRKLLEKWEAAPKHKAFATSNPNSGGAFFQACGSAWGFPSKSAAEAGAVKSCEQLRKGRCWVIRYQ